MSATARAAVALAGMAVIGRTRPAASGRGRLFPFAVVWWPLPSALVACGVWCVGRMQSLQRAKAAEAEARADVVVLAELCAMGLAAGMELPAALRLASEQLADPVRRDVDAVLRAGRHRGLSAALSTDTGRCRHLFRLAARSVETGAPVRGAVDAFVDDALATRRADALAAARRLPVKLLFPLALLILPGFMALTVGPTLLGSLEQISL